MGGSMANERKATQRAAITVAGDVVIDHHLYEGERRSATSEGVRGVAEVREPGGAALIAKLTREIRGKSGASSVVLGTSEPPIERHGNQHAFAVWKPTRRDARSKPGDAVWRAGMVMGYGQDGTVLDVGSAAAPAPRYTPTATASPPSSGVLVLDDAGVMFRHREHAKCWLLPKPGASAPDWIVLKTAAPVAQGDLWNEVVKRFSDRLVCIVAANDLRREQVKLGVGLSWERTIEELRSGLADTPTLAGLKKCRHLMITLGCDGAVWIDFTNKSPTATLVCDAAGAEDEFARQYEGKAFGFLSCMTSAVAHGLAGVSRAPREHNAARGAIGSAIRGGLDAMRSLIADGHGAVGDTPPAGFPAARLATIIAAHFTSSSTAGASRRFAPAVIPVPWQLPTTPPRSDAPPWMIVEMTQRPMHATHASLSGLARMLVLYGSKALERIPHATFGKLLTADRTEIEALRSIQRAMLRYDAEEQPKRPLSIGVFGPPGAGKSFGVKELAKNIYGDKAWMEFNLSQFKDASDLIGALHQVRDLVLGGVTPVVFWDEFDSQQYRWLQLLLAPMQDARFQEGQLTHAVGKCVFVFAGGTRFSFGEFAEPAGDRAQQEQFVLAKGPDFASRLDEYYDVLGPNRRTIASRTGAAAAPRRDDTTDQCHSLRRAILVRSFLQRDSTARLNIDSDLLDALLLVPNYRHGARSLEKLAKSLSVDADGAIRRSTLPPPRGLEMHVESREFLQILARNAAFKAEQGIETLASAIHTTWRSLSVREGWTMDAHLNRPYQKLAAADQEDNRAAARRMPEVLALAGLELVKRTSGRQSARDRASVVQHLEHHVERLAEVEHDGWFDHRARNGWKLATEKNALKKEHHALVPYSDLSESDRKRDRNAVLHYPDFASLAKYDIRFIKDSKASHKQVNTVKGY